MEYSFSTFKHYAATEYSFPKLVWTVVKVLFGIACTVMIAGIFYVLIVQFLTFIKEVNEEIIYMIR